MNACPFRPLTYIGQQTLTVSNTAVGFTASNTVKNVGGSYVSQMRARYAFVTVEDQPIRWSVGGTPEAGTGGHEYAAGTSFWLFSEGDITNFLAIRTGGTDGQLHATFYA